MFSKDLSRKAQQFKRVARGCSCIFILGIWFVNAPAYSQSLEDQILSGNFDDAESSEVVPVPTNATRRVKVKATQKESSRDAEDLIQKNLPEVDEDDLIAVDEAVVGPKAIPKSHILVVQHQTINKEGRHEIMPFSFGIQPADSFRKQFQWGFSYTYHFNESFAVEPVHVGFLFNDSTGLAKNIRDSVNLEVTREEPVMVAGASVQWTPLRSKAAMLEDVYYFEGYFIGGGGTTRFESGFVGMAMAGIGFRAYVTERALVKLEVRDYIDFKSESDQRVNVLLGAALLWGN